MPNHTSHKDHDTEHRERHASDRDPASESRDRSEQNRTAEIDRQRALSRSPGDMLQYLEKHQEEVKKDEEERTKAFQDSARGKRIEANAKRTQKDAEGKDVEHLSEEDAKKASREAMPPAVKEDGTVDLPVGAALPPAVPEPRHPNAGAWEQPLAEPPYEDVGTPQGGASHRKSTHQPEHARA